MNSHLLFQRINGHLVAKTRLARLIDKKRWRKEQSDAFNAFPGAGKPRQHEMYDVTTKIVIARRDEDLCSM